VINIKKQNTKTADRKWRLEIPKLIVLSGNAESNPTQNSDECGHYIAAHVNMLCS
jgi:hypothetical protein